MKLAQYKFSAKVIHIDNAQNGLNCNCVCSKCGKLLEAVQGKKKEWHFRHHESTDCVGSEETLLHKFAKQIILENRSIAKSSADLIEYKNPLVESIVGDFKADVIVFSNDERVIIEIKVTHANSRSKEDYYRASEQKSIEIDLSDLIGKDYSYSYLKDMVLHKAKRRIIFWEKEKQLIPQNPSANNFEDIVKGLFFVIGLVLCFRVVFKKW